MSEQDGKQASTLQPPTSNDPKAWMTYWKELGQSWRAEPEIDAARQKYLDERRSIKSDIERGNYPFKGIKLSRADVEWLLAAHENGHGPVDWHDESQEQRQGIDLRGAELRKANLAGLPLTRMIGGQEWRASSEEERSVAVVHLEGANLEGAQLQEAYLEGAELQDANLRRTQLQRAYLEEAQLQDAYLSKIQLQGLTLYEPNCRVPTLY